FALYAPRLSRTPVARWSPSWPATLVILCVEVEIFAWVVAPRRYRELRELGRWGRRGSQPSLAPQWKADRFVMALGPLIAVIVLVDGWLDGYRVPGAGLVEGFTVHRRDLVLASEPLALAYLVLRAVPPRRRMSRA